MGGSGKWLKSIFTPKKHQTHEEEIHGGVKERRKWGLWRTSSGYYGHPKGFKGGRYSVSDRSGSSFVVGDDAYAAAMAAIIRANPRDFMAIRQEWAAVRIQTVFRGFLARRALRALKAVVRLQAIFRGRLIRKQADVTLKCMQALVRVQAHVRGRSVMSPPEGISMHSKQASPVNHFEQGWCDYSPGTVKKGGKRLQSRQKVDIKKEKVSAYNFSQQLLHSNPCSNLRTNKPLNSLNHNKLERSNSGRSWLDGWIPEKPWENRVMKENHIDPSNATLTFSAKNRDFQSNSPKMKSFEVRKSNATTPISVKPPICRPSQFSRSSTDSGSTFLYNDGSSSSSSSPVSSKPSYMNLTESTKAKQRVSISNVSPRYSEEDSQFLKKSMTVGIAGSEPYSVNLYDDLYPVHVPVDRYQCSERCGY